MRSCGPSRQLLDRPPDSPLLYSWKTTHYFSEVLRGGAHTWIPLPHRCGTPSPRLAPKLGWRVYIRQIGSWPLGVPGTHQSPHALDGCRQYTGAARHALSPPLLCGLRPRAVLIVRLGAGVQTDRICAARKPTCDGCWRSRRAVPAEVETMRPRVQFWFCCCPVVAAGLLTAACTCCTVLALTWRARTAAAR